MKKTILCSILLILPIFSWAVSTTMVISEFASRGPNGANDDFIEIKNISASPFDMNGYEIARANASGTISVHYQFTTPTIIPAGKTFLLANSNATSYSALADATYSTSFSDDAQLCIRETLNTGNILDAVAFGITAPLQFGNTDTTGFKITTNVANSIERKPTSVNTTDTDCNACDFQLQTSPTPTGLGIPKLSNALRVPFVPNALQSDTVSAVIIAAGGHTITASSVTWSVNSVTQTAILMSSIGSTYSAVLPGQADGSVVQYTITGYDNATNNVGAASGYIVGTTSISKIRTVDSNGVPVYNNLGARARGSASVANIGESFVTGNIMSIFIQDASGPLGASGLDVFTRSSSLVVNRGDTIVAEGVITNFNGLLELAVDTVTGPTQGTVANIGSGTPPTPLVIPSVLSLNESYEGILVRIADCNSAFISAATSGTSVTTTFYRNGNPGTLGTLRIQSTVNVNMTQFPPTYPVTITGIVSQNDVSSPFDSGYQLIPRSTTDFSNPVLVVVPETDLYIKLNQIINLSVSGGSAPYTWSINSTGGATGSLSGVSANTATFTTGNLVGKVFITVQDSTGNQSSTGLFSASATSAPLVRDEEAYTIIRKD